MRQYKIANQIVSVRKNSLNYNDKVNERTTCSFVVMEPDFEIEPGMDFVIYDDVTKIATGTIESSAEETDSTGSIKYVAVSCVDFSQLIDKRIVYDTFENELAGNIVRVLLNTFFVHEGIAEGTIQDGPQISKAVFNYDNGNVALNYLAELTGYSWFIDNEKKLNFFEKSTFQAPFEINDESNNFRNLKVKKTRAQYRNRQYVRAGLDTTQLINKEKPTPKPDGVSRNFFVRFPVADKPMIFIDGVQVHPDEIGVNGFDQNKKFYFSYNSNQITQDNSLPELSVELLEVSYRGLIPIIVVADNPSEFDSRKQLEGGTGIYESVIQEQNVNSRDAALELANAKLDRYGIIPKVITFNTYEHGLKAGQLLPIQNSQHNINDSFLIESVNARDDNGLTLYGVKALDGSALGGWERFFKDLIGASKKLVIRENEVLVLLSFQQESTGWNSSLMMEIIQSLFPSDSLFPDNSLTPGIKIEEVIRND